MPNIFGTHLPKLISALKRFICGFSQTEKLECEIKPKKVPKTKKPDVFEASKWCCVLCTFINEPMLHFCEMCNGPKQTFSTSQCLIKSGSDKLRQNQAKTGQFVLEKSDNKGFSSKKDKFSHENDEFLTEKDENFVHGNFLFTQLKSCAIKTFCEMVCTGLSEDRVALFEPSFNLLMKTAVMATNLREFFSMEVIIFMLL